MKRDDLDGDTLAQSAGDWPVRVPHRVTVMPWLPELAEDYDYESSTEPPGGRTEARPIDADSLAVARAEASKKALQRDYERDCGINMAAGFFIGAVVCGALVFAWDQVREIAAPVLAMFGG